MTDDIYRGLSADEELAVVLYMDCNDRSLMDVISDQGDMSDDMRRFIDDLNQGLVKRAPRKKPSTDLRSLAIYNEVARLMEGPPKLPLKSSWKTEGAACIAGKKFHVGEDAAIRAYKMVNRAMNEAIDEAFSE
ncbi:MAG: hypothetical protein ACR65O_06420 [Methylomicrobium sp.]